VKAAFLYSGQFTDTVTPNRGPGILQEVLADKHIVSMMFLEYASSCPQWPRASSEHYRPMHGSGRQAEPPRPWYSGLRRDFMVAYQFADIALRTSSVSSSTFPMCRRTLKTIA